MATTRIRRQSNRFVSATRPRSGPSGEQSAVSEVFAEGGWPSIRVLLEMRGWSPTHIEQIHEQLRQGWPLTTAVRHVSIRMGTCPMRSRSLG
tara:strand:- start:298 stop:573 length:276 start_codon:yes stop_codon:yes gene_type:complete